MLQLLPPEVARAVAGGRTQNAVAPLQILAFLTEQISAVTDKRPGIAFVYLLADPRAQYVGYVTSRAHTAGMLGGPWWRRGEHMRDIVGASPVPGAGKRKVAGLWAEPHV